MGNCVRRDNEKNVNAEIGTIGNLRKGGVVQTKISNRTMTTVGENRKTENNTSCSEKPRNRNPENLKVTDDDTILSYNGEGAVKATEEPDKDCGSFMTALSDKVIEANKTAELEITEWKNEDNVTIKSNLGPEESVVVESMKFDDAATTSERSEANTEILKTEEISNEKESVDKNFTLKRNTMVEEELGDSKYEINNKENFSIRNNLVQQRESNNLDETTITKRESHSVIETQNENIDIFCDKIYNGKHDLEQTREQDFSNNNEFLETNANEGNTDRSFEKDIDSINAIVKILPSESVSMNEVIVQEDDLTSKEQLECSPDGDRSYDLLSENWVKPANEILSIRHTIENVECPDDEFSTQGRCYKVDCVDTTEHTDHQCRFQKTNEKNAVGLGNERGERNESSSVSKCCKCTCKCSRNHNR